VRRSPWHDVHIKPTPTTTTEETTARVHQRAHIEHIKSLSSHVTGGVAGPVTEGARWGLIETRAARRRVRATEGTLREVT
jgi:hypothetical protein